MLSGEMVQLEDAHTAGMLDTGAGVERMEEDTDLGQVTMSGVSSAGVSKTEPSLTNNQVVLGGAGGEILIIN